MDEDAAIGPHGVQPFREFGSSLPWSLSASERFLARSSWPIPSASASGPASRAPAAASLTRGGAARNSEWAALGVRRAKERAAAAEEKQEAEGRQRSQYDALKRLVAATEQALKDQEEKQDQKEEDVAGGAAEADAARLDAEELAKQKAENAAGPAGKAKKKLKVKTKKRVQALRMF